MRLISMFSHLLAFSNAQPKKHVIHVHLPVSGSYFGLHIKDETLGGKLAGFGFRQIYSLWHYNLLYVLI
jgi:hypothetical protein